ncbi:hypothetical protein ACFFKU_14100 [Kineococcus gynurae]|uniref:TM2 domain-containing protein n=1 Tax=Kineococcus gynurae TaxID=452979 RepID=A0ABV5LU19_9ACTN
MSEDRAEQFRGQQDPNYWANHPDYGRPAPQPQAYRPVPGQQVGIYPQQPMVVVPAKNPGLSVLFSFLWLGAGNLYAGQTALGVVLILTQLVCAPLAWILVVSSLGLGAIVTVPIWLAAFAVSAVTGFSACADHNRRLGLPG